jgi:hypothetical protein
LKDRVVSSDSFSFRAASIRWATYPPPPGSEPGYQVLHHWTAMGMMKTVAATSQLEKSGRSDSFGTTFGWVKSPASPPTSGSETA